LGTHQQNKEFNDGDGSWLIEFLNYGSPQFDESSNPSIHGEGDVMLTNKEFMEHLGIILSL